MSTALGVFLASMGGFLASGAGFWGYLRNRERLRENTTVLLMGLAHHKLITLGLAYIDRGWITHDEYKDFNQYLFEPYSALGGNGTTLKIMKAIERLPIRNEPLVKIEIRKTDVYGFGEVEEELYQGDERRGHKDTPSK